MEHNQEKVMTITLVLRLCWTVCSKFLNVKSVPGKKKKYLAHVWFTYIDETGKIKARRRRRRRMTSTPPFFEPLQRTSTRIGCVISWKLYNDPKRQTDITQLKKFFLFWCGPFLKALLLNLLQYCFCFMFWCFWPGAMWDLDSPTRDWTGRWSLKR